MGRMIEASITVNGVPLTTGQSMTVRVALSLFLMDMNNEDAIGTDLTGDSIRRGYLKCGAEVLRLMQDERRRG